MPKKKRSKKKTRTPPRIPWSPLGVTHVSAGLVLPAEPNMIELTQYTVNVLGSEVNVHIYEYGYERKYYFIEPWEDGVDKEYIRVRAILEYSGKVKARSIEEWINNIVSDAVSSPRMRRVVAYYLLRDIAYYGIYTVLLFDDEVIRFVVEPTRVRIKHKHYGVMDLGVKVTLADYRQLVEKLVLRYGRERVIVSDKFVASVGWGTSAGEAELPSHVSFTKMFTAPPEAPREIVSKLREVLDEREVILICGSWAYDYAALAYSLISSAHIVAVETATLPIPIRIRYRPEDAGVMLSAEQPDYVFVHPPDVNIAMSASLLGIGVVMVSLAELSKLRYIVAKIPSLIVVNANERESITIEYYVEGERAEVIESV